MEDVRHALERQLRTPTGYRLPRRIWAAHSGAEAPPARREAPDPESAVSEAVSAEAAGAEAEGTSEEGDDRKRKRSQGASSPTPASKRAAPSKQEAEGARRRQQRAEEIYRSVKVRRATSSLPCLCPTFTRVRRYRPRASFTDCINLSLRDDHLIVTALQRFDLSADHRSPPPRTGEDRSLPDHRRVGLRGAERPRRGGAVRATSVAHRDQGGVDSAREEACAAPLSATSVSLAVWSVCRVLVVVVWCCVVLCCVSCLTGGRRGAADRARREDGARRAACAAAAGAGPLEPLRAARRRPVHAPRRRPRRDRRLLTARRWAAHVTAGSRGCVRAWRLLFRLSRAALLRALRRLVRLRHVRATAEYFVFLECMN